MSYFSNYGNFCVHKVSKIVNLLSLDRFFQPHNTPKFVFFGRGSSPDPAGGAYDSPPDPPVGCGGGHSLPITLSPRRLRHLDPRRIRRLAARRLQHLDPG